MLQIFKKRKHKEVEHKETSNLDNIRQTFEEIKNKTTPQKRMVTLIYKTCCGCGCNETKVYREVDFDSGLKDGDEINDLLPTDII